MQIVKGRKKKKKTSIYFIMQLSVRVCKFIYIYIYIPLTGSGLQRLTPPATLSYYSYISNNESIDIHNAGKRNVALSDTQ
jgi:hypothetical protein